MSLKTLQNDAENYQRLYQTLLEHYVFKSRLFDDKASILTQSRWHKVQKKTRPRTKRQAFDKFTKGQFFENLAKQNTKGRLYVAIFHGRWNSSLRTSRYVKLWKFDTRKFGGEERVFLWTKKRVNALSNSKKKRYIYTNACIHSRKHLVEGKQRDGGEPTRDFEGRCVVTGLFLTKRKRRGGDGTNPRDGRNWVATAELETRSNRVSI